MTNEERQQLKLEITQILVAWSSMPKHAAINEIMNVLDQAVASREKEIIEKM